MAQWLKALAVLSENPARPGFSSQHPCGGSQLSITPVPGALRNSLGLCTYFMHGYTNMNLGKTLIYIKEKC